MVKKPKSNKKEEVDLSRDLVLFNSKMLEIAGTTANRYHRTSSESVKLTYTREDLSQELILRILEKKEKILRPNKPIGVGFLATTCRNIIYDIQEFHKGRDTITERKAKLLNSFDGSNAFSLPTGSWNPTTGEQVE